MLAVKLRGQGLASAVQQLATSVTTRLPESGSSRSGAGNSPPEVTSRNDRDRRVRISPGIGPLLLLLTFATLLSGCQGPKATNSTPDAETGPPPFPKQISPVHAVLRDGASRQLHQGPESVHEVHIVAITDNAQSTIEHEKPGDNHRYYSARIRIKNAGEAAIRSGTWALAGSDGVTYPRTVALGLGSDYQDYVVIQPGVTIEGTVAFEIPKDVTPRQLRYHVDYLSDLAVYFDPAS